MEGLILVAIVWGIFSAITKAAKKAQGGTTPPGRQTPKPPSKGDTSWQQMMGGSFGNLLQQLENMEKSINQTQSAPKPQPSPKPIAQPTAQHGQRLRTALDDYVSGEGMASREGFDDCHESMLTGPIARSESSPTSATPGFSLQFDQNALLQGVVYAEILSRHTPRRRGLR